jgi:hypothetical protein
MTQPNYCVLEGGGSKFLVKLDINFIHQLFYQTEFQPISKRQCETSEAMRILNIRHVISK